MERFITLLLTVSGALTVMANRADTVPTIGRSHPMPDAIGLTLSGGGAKGIAHIGVIEALEENGIPIDCITGTSMGAIVGGLYAMGYSPQEMLELIEGREFAYWSTGRIDPELTYYFLEPDPSEANVNIPIGGGGGEQSVLPTSLINPLPMNLAFVELFAPYTAHCGGNFDRLMVPYRCVASDVNRKRKAVFSQGDLGDCIRASMSFPMVFHPIEIDGRPMYDGGIYDNFPIDVMLGEFNPSFVLGVDVSSGNTPDNPDAGMMDQLEALIMQNSDYNVPSTRGMRMRMDLDRFGLLDFGKAREIYKIGYDFAMAHIDSLKARVTQRRSKAEVVARRAAFRKGVPSLVFSKATVSGGNKRQNEYLNSLFRHHRSDTMTMDEVRDAYYRALTSGKLRNLMPHAYYDNRTGLFDLKLKATLKRDFDIGIGGFLTTSTNSMLYLSGAFRTLSYNSLDMSIEGWAGQSYLAAVANARIQLQRNVPSAIGLRAVAWRQKYSHKDRFFFQTSDPTLLTTDEYSVTVNYGVAVGRHGKAEIRAGVGREENRFGHVPDIAAGERMGRSAAGVRLAYERFTLNDLAFPTSGSRLQVALRGYAGHYDRGTAIHDFDRSREWAVADVKWRQYAPLSKHFTLGTAVELTAGTHRRLPGYYASLAALPAYMPTASMANVFVPEFHAAHYGVVGVEPVWVVNDMFQLRSRVEAFLPYRAVKPGSDGSAVLGRPWHDAQMFGEVMGVFHLNFASVAAYAHYTTAMGGNWNFGLSFGYYLPAPKFFN